MLLLLLLRLLVLVLPRFPLLLLLRCAGIRPVRGLPVAALPIGIARTVAAPYIAPPVPTRIEQMQVPATNDRDVWASDVVHPGNRRCRMDVRAVRIAWTLSTRGIITKQMHHSCQHKKIYKKARTHTHIYARTRTHEAPAGGGRRH